MAHISRTALTFAILFAAHAATAQTPKPTLGVGMAGAPTEVIEAAHDGSWVAMCQARRDTDHNGALGISIGFNMTIGDAQRAYLVAGSGLGIEIDDVTAVDGASGRFIIERGHRHILMWPGRGPDLDLDKLGITDAGFSPSGHALTFTRKRHRRELIVVRDLTTGAERELDPGSGDFASYAIDPGEQWVAAYVFVLKRGETKLHSSTDDEPHHPRCWTGAVSDVITTTGTPPITRMIPMAGGPAREVPDLIGVLGPALIRRVANGALVRELADGTTSELVPASCGGVVIASDPSTESVVVACKRLGNPAPLHQYAPGRESAIGAAIKGPDADWFDGKGRYAFETIHQANDRVIDLRTGRSHLTGEFEQLPFAVDGDRSFVPRGDHEDKLVVIEPTGDRVLGAITQYGNHFQVGHFLYVQPLLVDTRTATVVGTAPHRSVVDTRFTGAPHMLDLEGHVMALAEDGRLLVGFGGPNGHWGFEPGPLEWLTATPLSAAPAPTP